MKLRIGGIEFDQHHYDPRGDVLYLNVGDPREPAEAFETAEGHSVEYDEHGDVIGAMLLNVKWALEHEGEVTLTWPKAHLAAEDLGPVLAAA